MMGPLLFLTGTFFLNFLARIILSPLLPVVEADLSLDHGQAGALFLLIASGYFAALMASGCVSSRITHRNTIIVSSLALGLVLTAISLSHSLWEIRIGAFILGAATGFYLPSGIATVTSLFHPRHWGKALGVHELGPNLAFLLAPLLSELLMQWVSWRSVLALTGIASALLGISFAIWGRGGRFPGEAPAFGLLRDLFREPPFWIMLILFGLAIGSSSGVYAMLPLFLVTERGMDLDRANTLVSLSRVPSLGLALLSGWVADRIGAQKTMSCVLLGAGMATVLLGLAPPAMTVPIVFLQAMLSVCFFPPAMVALSSIGISTSRNVVVSFTIPFSFLAGAGFVPALIGLFGKAGSFAWGIGLTGILIAMGSILSAFIRLPRR